MTEFEGLFYRVESTQGQKILIIPGFSSGVIIFQPKEKNGTFMASPSNALHTLQLHYSITVIPGDTGAVEPEGRSANCWKHVQFDLILGAVFCEINAQRIVA